MSQHMAARRSHEGALTSPSQTLPPTARWESIVLKLRTPGFSCQSGLQRLRRNLFLLFCSVAGPPTSLEGPLLVLLSIGRHHFHSLPDHP